MEEMILNKLQEIEEVQNTIMTDIKSLKTKTNKLEEISKDSKLTIESIKSDMIYTKASDMRLRGTVDTIKGKQEYQHQEIKILLDKVINLLDKEKIDEQEVV